MTRPEEVTRRVRANRDRAMGGVAGSTGGPLTMRGYLSSEVPFGNAKTAAYLMFGMADVFDMLERGDWHLAEAHLALLLAAGEQAALQSWTWPLAWLVTQLPEPAWSRIRHQPVPDTARPLSRLADQSLMSAVVAYYRDVSLVMEAQRKAAPASLGIGPSGGQFAQQQSQQQQQVPPQVETPLGKPRPARFPKRGPDSAKAKAAADAER